MNTTDMITPCVFNSFPFSQIKNYNWLTTFGEAVRAGSMPVAGPWNSVYL